MKFAPPHRAGRAGRGQQRRRTAAGGFTGSKSRLCLPPRRRRAGARGYEHGPQERPRRCPRRCPPPRAGRWPRRAPLARILAAGCERPVAGLYRPRPGERAPPPRPQAEWPGRSIRSPRRRSSPCPPSPRRPARRSAASPRATSPRRPRRSTRWWRGIPRSGRSMPTARRWRCCRARPRRALAPARGAPPPTASPTSRGWPPIRCSRRSPGRRGSRRSSPPPRPPCRPRSRAARRRSMPATPPGTPRPSGSSRASPSPTSRRPGAAAGKGGGAENILAELWRRGRAAGNHGDLYDNRDRGHSRLDPAAHPQLAFVDLCRGRPRRRARLRAEREPDLRPSDLRQLLDRDHRRARSGAACRASR